MSKKYLRSLILVTTLILFLSACVGAGNPLDGTSWILNSYQDGSGEMVNVLSGSTTTALFQANQISGIAGCNNYSASYEVDGDSISFGPTATTRKVCPSPLGIMGQESDYLNALSLSDGYEISDDTLEIEDDQGDTLLIFSSSTSR